VSVFRRDCPRLKLAVAALVLAVPLSVVRAANTTPPEESGGAGASQSEAQAAPAPTPETKPAATPAPETKPAAPAAEPGTPPKNLQLIYHGEATSILGKKVQGAGGEDMGRVVDLLVDADGQPRAAVIDFGGFLGVGSRKIAVDWHLLQFRPADQKAPMQLIVTRAEVQAAPEFKEKNEPLQIVAPPAEAPPSPEPAKQ